jgi:hypothetical protein
MIYSCRVLTIVWVSILLATSCGSDIDEPTGERLESVGDSVQLDDLDVTVPDSDVTVPDVEIDLSVVAPEETSAAEGDSSGDWVLIAAIGAVLVALVILIVSTLSGRSKSKRDSAARLNSKVGDIAGTSRWLHDQGSMEVLRTNTPDQLNSVWTSVRDRMIELEANTAGAANNANHELQSDLQNLGRSIAGLRGALESYVALRLNDDGTTDVELIGDSTRTVNERRRQVELATSAVSSDLR